MKALNRNGVLASRSAAKKRSLGHTKSGYDISTTDSERFVPRPVANQWHLASTSSLEDRFVFAVSAACYMPYGAYRLISFNR
jgi:hypothetical protein